MKNSLAQTRAVGENQPVERVDWSKHSRSERSKRRDGLESCYEIDGAQVTWQWARL